MTTVRDIMTEDIECINEHASVTEAARRMRDLDVGMLPICDDAGDPAGVVTDRDIVVDCVADGRDCSSTEVGTLADRDPVTVMVSDEIDTVLTTMQENQVRRVLAYEDGEIAGIVALQDLANALEPAEIGELTIAVTSDDMPTPQQQTAQRQPAQSQARSQQDQALAGGR